MENIITYILFGIMAIMGGASTFYLVVSLPAILIWKIYRCIRFGKRMTD